MRITIQGDTLNVSDIGDLGMATAKSFQSELSAALPEEVKQIDIDLARTDFVDCGGLGALAAIRKRTCGNNGGVRIRLLNAPQPVRRMVSLMKMERMFPIEESRVE